MSSVFQESSLDSSLPSWFKPERFLEPEFRAENYVNDLKRFVPLDTLSDELRSHVAALKNKLVEVVNEDYNDFVSLSTKLVNVDGAVLRMQKPLLEIKGKVELVRAAVLDQATELQHGLQRRQGVAAARELLELLQDTVHVMSKVEKLLGEVQSPMGSNGQSLVADDELEGRCRLLDRVCGEVSRINFYAAKGQDLGLIKSMRPRIQAATSRLQAELDSALRMALEGKHNTPLSICLHAYSALGLPQAAEQVVRQCLVTPTVRSALVSFKSRHQTPAGSTAGSSQPAVLPQVLPGMVQELQGKMSSMLSQALASSAASQSFDFLGGAVLPDIVAELEESLPGVFSPGIPAVFHGNYQAGMRLLDSLESQCSSTAQVEQFRQCAAYEAFMKKWSLPVFFSLQFQDIAGGLESQLAQPTLDQSPNPEASGGQPAFALIVTAAVWKGLQQTIADDSFLPQLADRFLRLAMQLLARYAAWVQQGMQQRCQFQQGTATSAAPVGGGQQAEQAHQGTSGWAKSVTPEQLAALLHDVMKLGAAVMDTFVPAVFQKVQGLIQEASEAVVMAFQASAQQLQQAGSSVLAALAGTITEQCVVVLKQLRGIVATFRMTKRSQPERPSHYVSAILSPLQVHVQLPRRQIMPAFSQPPICQPCYRCGSTASEHGLHLGWEQRKPLLPRHLNNHSSAAHIECFSALLFSRSNTRCASVAVACSQGVHVPHAPALLLAQAFLQGSGAQKLSTEARADLTKAVVAGISARYQQLAEDTLDTVRKTESSLKRLKTRQKAGATEAEGSNAGPAADTDKMIAMQLVLDVQEFGRLAKEAGVELAQVEAYQELWGVVATPADQGAGA